MLISIEPDVYFWKVLSVECIKDIPELIEAVIYIVKCKNWLPISISKSILQVY
jgi:hypothetical protein